MNRSGFHLKKWFLDFIGTNGETMIFYAATLHFKGIEVPYVSWIHYDSGNGVKIRSRFRKTSLPEKKDQQIHWHDDSFNISGTWQSSTEPLHARIFEGDDGFLDWNCHQPASKVLLHTNNRTIEGTGYAEELTLTTYPWNIPMNELRWGRFRSAHDTMVWIELRARDKKQWLWLNGEQLTGALINDQNICIPEREILLKLDRCARLESGNKISQLVEKRLGLLPGFKRLMPLKFLMASNQMWLSKGELQNQGKPAVHGMAIHEWVNFNTGTS